MKTSVQTTTGGATSRRIKTKIFTVACFIAFIIVAAAAGVFAQSGSLDRERTLTFEEISSSIDSYVNGTLTMRLKLKNVDHIFRTITFYDTNNHDVIFDISSRKEWKAFQAQLLNVHGGMNYNVEFTINGVGNLCLLDCTLISFEPVILNLLPESKKAE